MAAKVGVVKSNKINSFAVEFIAAFLIGTLVEKWRRCGPSLAPGLAIYYSLFNMLTE